MTQIKPFGKPRTYPLMDMEIGDVVHMPAPTPADSNRICRNVSQYGIRHGRGYVCRTNRQTRIISITRVR